MADSDTVGDDLEPVDDYPAAMTQDSPGTTNVRADGASIVQVEMGASKHLLLVLWLSSFISAAAVVGFIWFVHEMDDQSARIYVLEYDQAQMKAQMIENGTYEQTGH